MLVIVLKVLVTDLITIGNNRFTPVLITDFHQC